MPIGLLLQTLIDSLWILQLLFLVFNILLMSQAEQLQMIFASVHVPFKEFHFWKKNISHLSNLMQMDLSCYLPLFKFFVFFSTMKQTQFLP